VIRKTPRRCFCRRFHTRAQLCAKKRIEGFFAPPPAPRSRASAAFVRRERQRGTVTAESFLASKFVEAGGRLAGRRSKPAAETAAAAFVADAAAISTISWHARRQNCFVALPSLRVTWPCHWADRCAIRRHICAVGPDLNAVAVCFAVAPFAVVAVAIGPHHNRGRSTDLHPLT